MSLTPVLGMESHRASYLVRQWSMDLLTWQQSMAVKKVKEGSSFTC